MEAEAPESAIESEISLGRLALERFEIEFEDLAAFEKAYEDMFSNEDLAEIGARITDLVTGEGHNEIWHVHV